MAEIDELNAQHVEAMAALVRQLKTGEVLEAPGLLLASGGVSWPVANAALLSTPVAGSGDLERRIEAAAAYFESRSLHWTFFICDDWIEPRLRALVPARGLAAAAAMTGMVAEDLAPAARTLPALDYRRVEDHETRCALADINTISYGVPLDWGRELLDSEAIWHRRFQGYLGYRNGTAVTAAAAGLVGRRLYVGWVATLPQYRGRGYAEAVVRHALAEQRRATGVVASSLHATAAGRPLYERLGYRAVASYTVYLSE